MMSLPNRGSDSGFAAQCWADVGGTFTDCFVTTANGRRLLKVLSSGIVRGEIVDVLSDQSIRAKLMVMPPEYFWNGATIRLLQKGQAIFESVVTGSSSSGIIHFERALTGDAYEAKDTILELDPGLEAPVLGSHILLEIPLSDPLPAIDVRMGTTRGTNALLTRRGAKVGFITTKGFGDCLDVGEQNRPDLFALEIQKTEPLTRQVFEVAERLTASGEVLHKLDLATLAEPLQRWKDNGITSIAICLLHAHVNDVHEQLIAQVAREVGFENISVSSQVAPMIKLVSRAETTVLDAYLSPILSQYISSLERQFNRTRDESTRVNAPKSRLRLMTSGGSLVQSDSFRGGDSILSGPAGGAVALGKIADLFDIKSVIGFDMGGTSTDVCRYAGKLPRDYESRKAGVRVLTPMIAIHTVAAGGGSICDVVDGRMIVGPQSAGASPGPACYGRGGPLTVTDLNVILGRLPTDCFPFPLDLEAAKVRLRAVNQKLGDHAFASEEELAEGFLKIAVTHMAEAVRTVSTSQGSDPRESALVGFGGAAGGHVCAVAEAIGMKRIIDHRDASLLSALGIGLAEVGRIRTRGVYQLLDGINDERWTSMIESIRQETLDLLATESFGEQLTKVRFRLEADVRYSGTEATLAIDAEPLDSLAKRFHAAHRTSFGYEQPERAIEIATIRCEATIA